MRKIPVPWRRFWPPGGDKIVIAQDEDQHWIYFSVRDDSDNGSIIDFV